MQQARVGCGVMGRCWTELRLAKAGFKGEVVAFHEARTSLQC